MWLKLANVGTGVSAAVLAAALITACSVPVAANLDEADANQAVLLLERGGIGADKDHDPEHDNRFRVSVSTPDSSTAISLLAQENLPPKASPGVLEALGANGMVPSRLAEQARWTSGTSGDLERSLRTLDGVLSARVHLAIPVRDALTAEAPPEHASASVLVRHRGSTPPVSVSDIQRLVAGAVPGLAPENVAVVLSPSPQAPAAERELARVGPLTVTRGSLSLLRVTALGIVGLNLLFVTGLLLLWSRLRRTELALTEARSQR